MGPVGCGADPKTHHLALLPFHLAGPIALVHLCLCSVKKKKKTDQIHVREEMSVEPTFTVAKAEHTHSPPGWLSVRASEDW